MRRRIVIAAAQKYGTRGVGVELDPALVKEATNTARRAGVADRVTFRQADLFQTDLSDASVVTLFLSNSINLRLESKLKHELKPGARVVSHRFPIGNWKPDDEIEVQGARQVRETMPDAVRIFIAPPSEDALRARLVARGTDDPDQVQARLAAARDELVSTLKGK